MGLANFFREYSYAPLVVTLTPPGRLLGCARLLPGRRVATKVPRMLQERGATRARQIDSRGATTY